MSEELRAEGKPALGVRHALLAYAAPGSLFSRIEDTGAYGWALVTLLAMIMLTGYAQVQTGLIDETVERKKDQKLEEIEKTEGQLVDRIALKERMDSVHKQAEFTRMLARLGSLVAAPVVMLASFLLISSILYAIVALTGRKPEYHTLMSICVYAGFIELLGAFVSFAMMYHYRTIDVNTSLGMLADPSKPSVLAAIDPFRIWFWVLVAMGLIVTRQLGRRMAIAACTMMCLGGMGIRAAMEFAGK